MATKSWICNSEGDKIPVGKVRRIGLNSKYSKINVDGKSKFNNKRKINELTSSEKQAGILEAHQICDPAATNKNEQIPHGENDKITEGVTLTRSGCKDHACFTTDRDNDN
jgi:hypothetical protein